MFHTDDKHCDGISDSDRTVPSANKERNSPAVSTASVHALPFSPFQTCRTPVLLSALSAPPPDDMPFFTMKLAAGGTPAERKEALRGRWREIASLLATLAEAVQYAHQHGVRHRDLKPHNLLFDDADKVYLTDTSIEPACHGLPV